MRPTMGQNYEFSVHLQTTISYSSKIGHERLRINNLCFKYYPAKSIDVI